MYFQKYNLDVFEIPSFKNLISGDFNLKKLKKIEINNLLGRQISINNFEEQNQQFINSVICISGAGGSIGSEICNQLLKFKPSILFLLNVTNMLYIKFKKNLIH